MIINNKEVSIEELINDLNIDKDMYKKRGNGLILKDSQIEILKRYNIDYEKHTTLESLIFEIEEVLTYEEADEDLEGLSAELAELNYYNYTNK